MSAYDEDLLDEEDEDVQMAEKDLAYDAQWKIIQKNTFTRWANEHLKTINKTLNDLETDLSDGLRLVGLIEVLSGKKFRFTNRRPNFRTQKLENVTMALEFLERDEGIKIVNIDSGDIVDSKLKLILGLIWTLILHYSISMPMWEGEEPQPQEGGPTPKQRLLNWINSKVPDLPVKNFTTDWNDGKAIGALVDALAPGLCPDWEDWDPKKAKQNAKEAMDAAEKWLDVPQLIKPEEMINPKVDDLSMMTYLSQFPQAKLKPGAPLRPRLNAGKVRAYGPGVEPKGNMVNKPAKFTVETFSAGKGSLELLVLDPKGKESPVESQFNKDQKQTYSCVYTPKMEGEYRVIVKFGEKEIQKSPYKVMVEGAAGDPSKVTASGPGLEKTGVVVNKKTYFEVFTKGQPPKAKGLPGKLPVGGMDAGKGSVDVNILDPSGHRDKVKPEISQSKKDGVYMVEYTAKEVGEHTITITFNGTAIPKCPYHVTVQSAINPKAVYATGRGIQPKGVRVKQHAEFKVHTKDAGKAEVKVQIIGPGGANLNCTVKPSKTEEGVYECVYIPPKVGQYVINITFGGQHITKSPFRVDVGPEKTSKIVAFGPGLEGGVVNQPACFTVETNGETGALGFSIEGPSQAKIDCKDNGDGSADVTYWPTQPGEYAVHILCDEEDIPQAPYMAQIQPATTAFDASKVVAKGPGLEKDGVVVGKVAEFTVDAKKAGKAALHITCVDATYKAVEVIVKDNRDGTYACKYTSKNPNKHTIIITWGTIGIPKSPFRVNVSEPVNPGNVKVYGPGVERGVKTWVLTHFTVDCRSAGPGDVAIALTDPNGKDVPVNTIDNNDGTFTIEYEPRLPGTYTVAVFFATKEIPKSPIKVKVESSIDLSKVTVKGLEKPIMIGEKRTITVVTIKALKKDAPCTIVIKMPSGKTLDMQVTVDSEGYITVFSPTEEGEHTVTITYGGMPVPKSPFTVMVEIAVDISKVVVKGLETPIPLGETRPVYIVTMGLPKKDAPCKVTVTTPKNKTVELPVKKCPEGYTCDFKPTDKGEHKVTVDYDKKPAPDSPYKVDVVEPKVAQVEVRGLDEPIEVGENRPVTIDTSAMPKKDLPCKATVTSPKNKTVELPLKKAPQGYTTTFTPKETGPHKVVVDYDSKPVPKSPFTVEAVPKGSKPKFEIIVKGLETPVQSGEKRVVTIIVKIGNKKAPCKVTATNPKGRTSDLKTKPNPEGYETVFTPWDSGIHKIKVEFDSTEVPKSPFEVEVVKINFAAIVVKGLEKPIPLGETRKVSVITKDTGKPDLPCTVTVTSPKGETTDLPTSKTPEGYDCDFTPTEPGEHKVKVEYAAKEVPKSPFKVPVEVSEITPQKAIKPVESAPTKAAPKKPGEAKPKGGDVVVKGLETPVNPGEKRPVLIDTTNAPKKSAPCKVSTTNPKGRTIELKTKQVPDGYETTFSSWDKGIHTVKVEYDSQEVPDSPFDVVVEKIDVSKVTVKGLDTPIELGETRKVEILTAASGRPDAPCKVTVTTPKGETKEVPVEKKPEVGYDCDFTPTEKGEHKVKITYAGKEVPGSPFPVNVTTIDISQVTVKGLEKPIMVSEKRTIHIITTSTGKKDLPCKVHVTNPKGVTQELFTNKRDDGHETIFTPTDIGPHKVKIEVAGQEAPGSEFPVEVTKFEVKIEVEGLDTPILAGEKRHIKVIAPEPAKPNRFAPPPTCKVTVTNPKGRSMEPKVDKTPTGFETFYMSNEAGPHIFKVEHNGKEVHDSPFTVEVEKMEVRKVEVKGLETPIEVGEVRPIEINTASTGKLHAPCKVTAVGPKGDTKDLPTKETPEGYETTYAPLEVGPHKVKVEYGTKEVPKSPYPVDVVPKSKGPKDAKEPKVEVTGLETPVTVGEKRPVKVKTDKPDAPCTVTQTTPKGKTSDVPTKKVKDGYEATFAPLEEGPYKVKVDHAGKEVPGSPFSVDVKPKVDLGKVEVKGLETPIKVGEQRPITVDTKSTGKPDAPCKVTAVNPKGVPQDLPTKKTPEGFETIFAPLEKGPHVVKVTVDDKPVPKSPFNVDVMPAVDMSKVEVKGLEKPVEVDEIRPITTLTKGTGDEDAPCKVTCTLPEGRTIFLPTKKVPDGYESIFNPKEKGPHKIKVEFANEEIPKSPFSVDVVDKFHIKKVEVKGLETPINIGETRPITVDTSKSGRPDVPCQVFAKGPTTPYTELPTKKVPEGYECLYTPTEPGANNVDVQVMDKKLPDSPFHVRVESPLDECKVEIKGLESPIEVGEPRPVTVDTSKSGKPDAPCRVTVMNPKGQTAELPTKKIPEGYETVFAPLEPGPHKVAVNYAGQDVPKSPFPVDVLPKANVGAVSVSGLERPIEVGEPRPITINTTKTGRPDAPCKVMVMNPVGQTAELPTRKIPEGYETILNPLEPGPHQVGIFFAEQEVPKSPFPVDVVPRANVGAVSVRGLERPIEVGEPRPITVDTSSTGRPDAPCKVMVMNPHGQTAELPTKPIPEGCEAVLNPLEPGPHQVSVNFAGQEVPKSPFHVDVLPRANVGAVFVKGLETPIEVGEPRPITINTQSTGRPDAPCRVGVTNPVGQTAEIPVKPSPEGYETLFAPLQPGPHVVNVEFAGQPVPKSPFSVDVQPKPDTNAVTVKGLETPVEVGEARPIHVNTASTGKPDAPCKVQVSNPHGQTAELPLQRTPEGYQTVFAPLEPGPHKVDVNFAEKPVPKSPFNVDVQPRVDIGAVEVMGLETPIQVGEPRPVTIMTSTSGKPDAPCKVLVTNPKGQMAELPTHKIPEGYTCTLAPQEEGPHKVNVQFNNQEVPKSPFNVMAEPAIDFNKVNVTGLETPVEVGEIRPIQVETAKCGKVDAPCQLTATNPAGQVRELPLQKTPVGYQAQFAPLEEGPHLVAVKYSGKEVPNSPFKVDAVPQGPPSSKVKAYGPGLERGTADQPCQFTIDTREVTQPGGLGVTVEGPAESKIECRDNQDGTCDVTYYPTVPGDYTVNITYAEEHIPKSPYTAKVLPSGKFDVSGVKAYGPGLEPGVFLDSPTGFTVDAKSVTPTGEGKIRAIVTSPSGQKTESLVKNNNDGTYDVLYTPYQEGPNTIDVSYEDHPIPQSPVTVNATPGCDSSRVKAYGPGLESGVTFAQQTFTVDVKGAGKGGLALAIDGPAETQINCKDNRDGTCEVTYVPVKKGDYDITVKFADQNIPGSPFNVKVKDEVNPAKVKCHGPGLEPELVKTNQPNTFTVDTTEAGQAPLDVTYTDTTGFTKPAEIVPVEEGVYEASYFPVEEGPCTVDVKYNNQAVPNFPFKVDVKPGIDASKVEFSGDGVNPKVLASMPVQFTVDTRKAGPKDAPLVAEIERPDGSVIRPMLQNNNDGTYVCQYTPEDCGDYKVNVKYADQPCRPIKTTAVPTTGDASKCRITEGLQQTIQVDKRTVITVDASAAGEGKVTCRIKSPNGAEIDIDIVENQDDGTFQINFTPSFPGDYSISIKFGGQTIPDGDYIIQAVDDEQYQEYLQKQQPVGDLEDDLIQAQTADRTDSAPPGQGIFRPQEFCIPVGPIFNFVTAHIIMPSGKKAFPKIEDNKDGTVTVKYQPSETGEHELHVCYNKQEVLGSPFKFHVDAIDSGFVTAYGPGLSHGVVNVPTEFTINTKDAGAGGLSLAIEGPSKTEIKCKDNEDGTCTVTYTPLPPGSTPLLSNLQTKTSLDHLLLPRLHVTGEPKQKAMIGRSSEVALKITETDITNLTASIRSPSGHEEPCMLKRLPNGHLGISFTPRETGEHLVNVFRDGQHIPNSPFKITVGETELGNATKVKVFGKGLHEGMANEVNEFTVDTREAGYGGLSLSIEGPSKADIECHDNEDGTCRVTYKPTEPGTYIINIKFADEHVSESPFKVKIGGDASERITERIMRHRDAVDVSHVGSECELSLKIPGTSPFDMTASVTSPNGVTELCDVVSLDDSHYSIKFVPKEMGIHTVSVKHKDMHIPGSPFQFTVGPIAGGGAHKVHAAGVGLERGEVSQPNEFNIYTREAGAGGLSIAVEGPSKAEVDFEDRKDGSCGVTYKVAEPGEYLISIKFNDDHIPESPFRVPISASIGDARKISVSALQNKGLQIGKPAAFVVNFNGAPKGKLQARVLSPSGTEDAALIQEIDDGEYAVRFIPRENGPHLVYVSFDGCQIPDSPFRVQVGTIHADPGMVQAYGEGLKSGKTGQTAKFIVNTVNAGSGALAVTVEGPSKVKLECREVDEGYEFSYNPTAPGDYLITIKYAGTNIAGSPYKARIEGQGQPSGYQEQASVVVETVTKTSVMSKFASLPPFDSDASKVTVEGNGLKKGYRNKQCSFNVDTSKAGMNMLFIGMIGPKGPCEELIVKNVPGNPYKISYLVKERGDYMLAIKWGEEHIPGSPFYLRVD